MANQFPDIVRAWKQRDRLQWEIGDKINNVAPPGKDGVNDDGVSIEKLKQIKAELEANGYPCPIKTLMDYRTIAHAFLASDRSEASWTVCRIAGDPQMLARIVAESGDKRLTASGARSLKDKLNGKVRKPRARKKKTDTEPAPAAAPEVKSVTTTVTAPAAAPVRVVSSGSSAPAAAASRATRVSVVAKSDNAEVTYYDADSSAASEMAQHMMDDPDYYRDTDLHGIKNGVTKLRAALDKLEVVVDALIKERARNSDAA